MINYFLFRAKRAAYPYRSLDLWGIFYKGASNIRIREHIPCTATHDGSSITPSTGGDYRLSFSESLGTNADDRLSLDPLGRIEGGNGVVEAGDLADIGPQPSLPHPLDDLAQLSAIGHHDEVDS